MTFKIFSPLEQFEILPIIPIQLGSLDFSITNEVVILLVIFFLLTSLFYFSVKESDSTLYIIPHRWQIIIEGMFNMILSMIGDNIASKRGQLFFPLVFTIFCFILSLNLVGLVPYSFTLTSHQTQS